MTFRIVTLPDFREMRVRPNDADWWFAQHDRYRWTYARTMPFAPHSYIWRGKEMTTDDYDRMFGAVKTFGTPGKYWDRTQLYLINPANGYRYWLMDRHYFTCTILNMATDGKTYGEQNAPKTASKGWSEYDEIAPWWDDVYRDFDRSDGTALWRAVHEQVMVSKPSLLDIGAGTGGSLDAQIAPSDKTTAVDPSQGMLNDLVLKYPRIAKVVPSTFESYLDSGEASKHDIVAASLGSASYLRPEEIRQAMSLARYLGVFAFYQGRPSHREELPPTHSAALEYATSLPGAVSRRAGNFLIVSARP